jgi:hypothetical protein
MPNYGIRTRTASKVAVTTSSLRQVAGLTGLMLAGAAVIASILTLFLIR